MIGWMIESMNGSVSEAVHVQVSECLLFVCVCDKFVFGEIVRCAGVV